MTYTSIKQILVEKDENVRGRYQSLLPNFELMKECFNRLRAKRLARGSIDFDLPEPEIIIDLTGDIQNIVKAERHMGHMIIEEFMIAANESVARFLTKAKVGCVYRVHEHPNSKKLHEFAMLIHNLGYHVRIGERVEPGSLARVVGMVRGKPEERLVNTSLLRSMARAVYSTKNIGHYGLASECYCHFTSPIRRYPDLVVHRLLKIALSRTSLRATAKQSHEIASTPSGPRNDKTGSRALPEIAEQSSSRERRAMEAEREMLKLHTALFMKDKIGEEFEGVISHVTKFGFFVELIEFYVEGLVRLDNLGSATLPDRYLFKAESLSLSSGKRGKTFKIGDRVKVMVEGVDVTDREVNFALLDRI